MSPLWKSSFGHHSTQERDFHFHPTGMWMLWFYRIWSSQPLIGSNSAGNFELWCAILFSGCMPTKSIRMLQFLNMATIYHKTFMYHQQHYLHPTISSVWKGQQRLYFQEDLNSILPIRLGGAWRADTPGHSARRLCYNYFLMWKYIYSIIFCICNFLLLLIVDHFCSKLSIFFFFG